MSFTIRDLTTERDYKLAEALQRATWGQEFTECVPSTILMISQKVGGVAAGAFDGDDLVAFVFGLSGVRGGELVHWSHMLAVNEGLQGIGLGRTLKLYQRERLLEIGIEKCYWTYDPLVARNAHLNINRLGARPAEYVSNMYGSDTKSERHSGLGTDRFIVAWNMVGPETGRALAGDVTNASAWSDSPIVNEGPASRERVRIEVPEDVEQLKGASLAEAQAWRASTRLAFTTCLDSGYSVEGFQFDRQARRCFYLLRRV